MLTDKRKEGAGARNACKTLKMERLSQGTLLVGKESRDVVLVFWADNAHCTWGWEQLSQPQFYFLPSPPSSPTESQQAEGACGDAGSDLRRHHVGAVPWDTEIGALGEAGTSRETKPGYGYWSPLAP